MKAERCQAVAKSGKPCGATVVADGMCAWHAPSWADRRRQWSATGGRKRANRERAKKQVPEALTPAELQGYIAVTLKGTLSGRISLGIANAVASLTRAAVAVREATEVEERLAALEEAAGLGQRRGA